MMRHALEKGVASIIARFLLESRHDALFAAIARADALPPEEIAQLREETLAHLAKVRDDGAPYADAVTVALKEVVGAVAELGPDMTTATSVATKTAKAALTQVLKTASGLHSTVSDFTSGDVDSSQAPSKPPATDDV